MKKKVFTYRSDKDGLSIISYCYSPDEPKYKGMMVISHGMVEHAKRYERFAKFLTDLGYLVYIPDQRGHGKTAGEVENVGYLSDKDGLYYMLDDFYKIVMIAKEEHPDLKVFILGHSLGSFLGQGYLEKYGSSVDGIILSGTNGKNPVTRLASKIAAREIKKNGKRGKSLLMNKLSFGNYNKAFKPNRTEFDWLSRDEVEVDKYINDPYCGVVASSQMYYDFMDFLTEIYYPSSLAGITKKTPIYLISGALDPVGNYGKGVEKLFKMYQKLGMKDVEMKLYPKARHEILNETNRIEVMNDILQWMERH